MLAYERPESRKQKLRQSILCLCTVGVCCWVAACEQTEETTVRTPEDTVQRFVERMRAVHGDPVAAKAAYELLWEEAKRNLAERAKRASAVAGRAVAPEEMLAPSRFSVRFIPKHFTSRIQGNWAVVAMSGDTPDVGQRRVQCVREGEAWKIVLKLPPLPPISKRREEATL